MALFPFCRTPSGPVRATRLQLVLYCFLLTLIIYFLQGRKAGVSMKSSHPFFQAVGPDIGQMMTEVTHAKEAALQTPPQTPWGAPLVWGATRNSVRHRAKFGQRGIRTGLLLLVVGTYGRFLRNFIYSAETYFLPGNMVTYYILTENRRSLDPPIELGPGREIKVLPVGEMPGWKRLAYRRMALFAEALKNPVGDEVEYVFCADIDQKFVAPVREEILGDLVATLHPELYGMPRNAFPYEVEEVSTACVEEDEGDYYYTSELYGGLVSEVFRMTRACSLLILQDQANKIMARGLEESYLNRYLINQRPTRVLSPEYSSWDSALVADVPVQRLISLGRQCDAPDIHNKEEHKC